MSHLFQNCVITGRGYSNADSIWLSNSIGNLLKNWYKWGQRGESLKDTGGNLYYEEVLEILEVTSISVQPMQV